MIRLPIRALVHWSNERTRGPGAVCKGTDRKTAGATGGAVFLRIMPESIRFPANEKPAANTPKTPPKNQKGVQGVYRLGKSVFPNKKGFRPKTPKPLYYLVPEVGIEPTRTQGPGDFESPASTYFTTPAKISGAYMPKKKGFVNVFSRMARFNWIFQGLDEFGPTRFCPLSICGPLGLWRPL